MPFTYILYSQSSNSFYIGATSDEVEFRLEKQLKKHYGSSYCASKNDWQIFLQIHCQSMHQALKIEKHIKNMKSKKYINDLKTYPDIIERLRDK